jgi:intraflagellar transport protein 52
LEGGLCDGFYRGPISYPLNRPVCGGFMTKNRKGKLIVLGSLKIFEDDYIEKEDNAKIHVILLFFVIF